ncbi:hypothetical protein SK128_006582 [Halocaridina rubra]|uniref:Cytochrome P450 n=1 Tax=Halocaridina rubra TaxID=373956 RepID=A0AAN8XWK8_HALRR
MWVLLTIMVILLTLVYRSTRKPKGFPPGPPRYPLVGYAPFLEKHLVHKHMWRLSSTYGSVYGIYLGPERTVIVNGWEACKEALANDDLNGRPINTTLTLRDDGLQKGVMFTEGELWKEQRRFTLHHLRNLGFGKRSHETVIHEEASELINEIENANESIQLQIKLGVSAVNILWALMGGTRFHRDDPELITLVDKLNQMFRAGEVSGSIVDIFPFLHRFMPKTSNFGTVMDGFLEVKKFIERAIDEHKASMDTDNPRDFIDLYLKEMQKNNNNEESTYNDDQLVALCTDLFSAGTETGSASVSFAILLCTLHPEVMRKLQEEIDTVVGQDRLPSIDDRPKLIYTEAVLTEVFRLRGAAPLTVPHCAVRDTVLQGHHIPARTMVMINLYSIQMDPEYWGDPEVFRPERFIKPDGTFLKDERMIPFGKGKRVCLGESLARMTLFLLFTALVQKFTFSMDPAIPVTNTEGIAGFTLGPPPFKVFAKSRV